MTFRETNWRGQESGSVGTDRIAEVAEVRGWADDEAVVNLQGDESSMPAELVSQVAGLLLASPEADIATRPTPNRDRAGFVDPISVQVHNDWAGQCV